MTKIFKINFCGECPNRTANDIYWYCKENEKGSINSYDIPDWCPLPDASQPVIEADAEKAPGKSPKDVEYLWGCKRTA